MILADLINDLDRLLAELPAELTTKQCINASIELFRELAETYKSQEIEDKQTLSHVKNLCKKVSADLAGLKKEKSHPPFIIYRLGVLEATLETTLLRVIDAIGLNAGYYEYELKTVKNLLRRVESDLNDWYPKDIPNKESKSIAQSSGDTITLWETITKEKETQSARSALMSTYLDFSDMWYYVPGQMKQFFISAKFNLRHVNLKRLNLTFAKIVRDDVRYLGSFLEQYKKLEELNLDHNWNLGGGGWPRLFGRKSGVELLASALYGYPSLHKLSLTYVYRDQKDTYALIDMVDSLPMLVELRFNDYEQRGNGIANNKLRQAELRARERAELQGYPLPAEFKVSWTSKIKQAYDYYIASHSSPHEEKNEYNENQFYDLTRSLVETFIPGDSQKKFLQDKEKKKEPLNFFEGLQWRAAGAHERLNQLEKPLPLKHPNQELDPNQELEFVRKIRDFGENFIIGKSLRASIYTNLAAGPESAPILDWLKICALAEEKSQLRCPPSSINSLPTSTEWPEELNSIQARWFYTHFRWTLDPLWQASSVIKSGTIAISRPLQKREQVTQRLKEAALHAALAIPAIGELGHALFHGAQALHSATANSNLLQELAHVAEFAGSVGECLEEMPPIQRFFHRLSLAPRKAAEKITQKKWLNTYDWLENLFMSFTDPDDYTAKIEGLVYKFMHHFHEQLGDLAPNELGVGRLGRACAQHVAQALMLGLLHHNDLALSPKQFISATFRWLTYIPMESPPWLKLRDGSPISADTLLRRTGLKGYVGDQEVDFHWSSIQIETLDDYNQHLKKVNSTDQADYERVGHRWADKIEIDQFNEQLQMEQKASDNNPAHANIVLGQEVGKPIARLTLKTDAQVLYTLRKKGITSVTANTYSWKSGKEEIKDLREIIRAQGERLDRLEGVHVSNQTPSAIPVNQQVQRTRQEPPISQNSNTLFNDNRNTRLRIISPGALASSEEEEKGVVNSMASNQQRATNGI